MFYKFSDYVHSSCLIFPMSAPWESLYWKTECQWLELNEPDLQLWKDSFISLQWDNVVWKPIPLT